MKTLDRWAAHLANGADTHPNIGFIYHIPFVIVLAVMGAINLIGYEHN